AHRGAITRLVEREHQVRELVGERMRDVCLTGLLVELLRGEHRASDEAGLLAGLQRARHTGEDHTGDEQLLAHLRIARGHRAHELKLPLEGVREWWAPALASTPEALCHPAIVEQREEDAADRTFGEGLHRCAQLGALRLLRRRVRLLLLRRLRCALPLLGRALG